MLALVVATRGYIFVGSTPSPVLPGHRRAATPHADAPKECWNPPCRSEIPDRWKNKHDCDRPSKWRELLDDEDCRIYQLHRDEFEEGPGAAVAIAERAAAVADQAVEEEAKAKLTKEVSRKYTTLVPTLTTMDEFLEANRVSAETGRLMVVKFYSKNCRACLRIAAKYRRLALDLSETCDCYEAEHYAAELLLERLDVTQVPSIQIWALNEKTVDTYPDNNDDFGPEKVAHWLKANINGRALMHTDVNKNNFEMKVLNSPDPWMVVLCANPMRYPICHMTKKTFNRLAYILHQATMTRS